MTLRKHLAVLMAMGLLMLLLAACGGDEEEPTAVPPVAEATVAAPVAATAAPADVATVAPAATAVPEATAIPAAPEALVDGDPLQAVISAMQAQMVGGPYRATSSIETDGTISEMVAEVIPPETMSVTIGGGNMSMIMVDGSLWSKTGDMGWQQMGSADTVKGILDSIQGQVDAGTYSNVQFVGEEPVMGVGTRVFTFTSTLGEGEGAIVSEVKVWISTETGLPVRSESTSTGMGFTTKTIQTVEYDDSIVIKAPTP